MIETFMIDLRISPGPIVVEMRMLVCPFLETIDLPVRKRIMYDVIVGG